MLTMLIMVLGMNNVPLIALAAIVVLRYTFVPSLLVMVVTGFERMCVFGPFSEKDKPARVAL